MINNLRRIKNKTNKMKQNTAFIITGRYPMEYNLLLKVIEKYLSNFNNKLEIIWDFHTRDPLAEAQKIINEYLMVKKLLTNTDVNVILLKTADLIAHDMLYLILNCKLDLLKPIISYERRLIIPFKNVFLTEVSKILKLEIEPYNHCTTYEFILKTIESRPTTIYGIINYIKSLSFV